MWGGDGLWVCALKSSGLGGQEYFKVQVGWTKPENISLLFLPSFSKDLGQKYQLFSKWEYWETGEAESGTGIEVCWEEAT